MATAAFKSNSKRTTNASDSPKINHPQNPNPIPQKPKLRRSLSVSALSRSPQVDIASEFLNKRDNPLFWATGGSPNAESPTTGGGGGGELEPGLRRVRMWGREGERNGGGGKKEEVVGRRRSLSRVNNNGVGSGDGRRGRSVSRARLASGASEGQSRKWEFSVHGSDAEQDSGIPITYGGRSSSIRASNVTGKQPVSGVKAFGRSSSATRTRHPSVGSPFDSRVSNWEDGISTSSLSEAEEKTIKAVFEQMKSFEGDNLRKDTASSEIYETVRSEVRRAIADLQDDLQDAIRRNSTGVLASTDVTEISPKLVKPGAVELVLDIRREYAKELEESQERARKLRSDLAIEEHRKQELSRILKETLPEPKTSSVPHKPRLGRKRSSERKKISKRLTDEAMSYFDECVSISTFDSSDFSAAEDAAVNSVNTTTLTTGATTSQPHDTHCISPSSACIKQQMIEGDLGCSSTARSSSNDLITDRVVETTTEWERKSRFSFGHKPLELQHDIKSYIKTFEKDTGIDGIASRSSYNVDDYNLLEINERLLFDKVLFRNQQESGSLHICGGVAVPFLPFASLF
ncbi:hypothetical protein OSB04_000803 [Centaurea solstitialis]|uniref:Uncharacterized protein n=1 Tax=Centaurea solstitialis TaxID=347529 RepID=A0AA38U851_9ASTR|nr:hypothetical protein OSB04_000803 [Centaurea solstitialis]